MLSLTSPPICRGREVNQARRCLAAFLASSEMKATMSDTNDRQMLDRSLSNFILEIKEAIWITYSMKVSVRLCLRISFLHSPLYPLLDPATFVPKKSEFGEVLNWGLFDYCGGYPDVDGLGAMMRTVRKDVQHGGRLFKV